MNPYIERLHEEWKQHGKVIIAVDFDDTLRPWKMSNVPVKEIFNLLNDCKNVGAYIVIFTACNPDRYEEIYDYCASQGLKIDAINKTPIDLPYGKDGAKIYANIFLDDRAGLLEAMTILEEAMYLTRAYNHSQIYPDGPPELG